MEGFGEILTKLLSTAWLNKIFVFLQKIIDVLREACEDLKWKAPTKIQREAIPHALEGRDIIALAETGSG